MTDSFPSFSCKFKIVEVQQRLIMRNFGNSMESSFNMNASYRMNAYGHDFRVFMDRVWTGNRIY
jgi:hypothetical protein